MLQESFDLIVCVGGTGQGRSDRLRGALRSVGAQSIDSGTKLSSSLPYLCASLGTTLILGLPGNSLGFINIAQRVVIPLVWNAFRTQAFEFCRVSVVLGFEAEAKEGTICVRLANHGSQLIALPMQKGTGRASVFRDAAAVVDNPRGTLIPAGTVVTAEKFFNGIIGYK